MSTKSPSLAEMIRNAPPPKWVVDMHDHYAENGFFRPEDILRVLGDPNKGVDMNSAEAVFSMPQMS